MLTSRRIVVLVALVVVLGGLAAGARLVATGLSMARALTDARAAVTGVEDLDDVAPAAEEAEEELARAERLAQRATWRLAGRLPPLSGPVGTVDDVRALAVAMVELTGRTTTVAALARDDLRTPEGHLDGRRLARIRDGVADLETAAVRDALERLERRSPGPLAPARIHDARREALEAGAALLTGVEQARAGATLAASLLGLDAPSTYLLGMQNPAELRGTGGLIGQIGVLEADAGRLALRDVRSYTELVGDPEHPEHLDVPADFAERYDHVAAGTFLGNVNVDPDLPTVAPVLRSIYHAHTGERVDGVVLVDPLALTSLMEATGPVEVPAAVAGDLPTTIGADEVAEVAMVDAYLALGGRDERREAFLTTLTERLFERLVDVDPTDPSVLEALREAATSRRVQVAAADERVQEAAEQLGVAGRLPDPQESDLVAVTANNAGANKQDAHVAHGLTVELELGGPRRLDDGSVVARRDATYELVVDNPLEPGDLTTYITGSAPADAAPFEGQTGPPALNRTWFTVWEREDAELRSASASQGEPRIATGTVAGRRGFDHHLETQGPGREQLTLATRSRARLRETDEGLRYELTVWRQPKAIADELELRLTVPPGWEVVDARLDTDRATTLREPGAALGFHWPPELAQHPDGVTIQGALTTDLHLVVDLG